MSPAELSLLHALMGASRRYLEFGAGESTVHAAGLPSIERIDSVESSAAFIEGTLRPRPEIALALAAGRLVFHVIDIGPVGQWSDPIGAAQRAQWPGYALRVFDTPSAHDLALVDGRFRVACTLACLLHAPPECRLAIHDFWSRPEYHLLLEFLDVVDRADTLGVFVRKPAINVRRVRRLLHRYQYLPRDTPSWWTRLAGRLGRGSGPPAPGW